MGNMDNDLPSSKLDRQNILNNRYALEKIEEHLGLGGIPYQDTVVFTKQQLSGLFNVNDVTIERYITNHGEELTNNGYSVLKGQALKDFLNTTGGILTNEGSKIYDRLYHRGSCRDILRDTIVCISENVSEIKKSDRSKRVRTIAPASFKIALIVLR